MVMRLSTGITLTSVWLLQHPRYTVLYKKLIESDDNGPSDHSVFVCIQGLVVPVLRDATHMNYAQIERGINELGVKVRTHR